MKLLGIRLCDHDSNITITDGTKVQYHKTERYYGVKHHHMGFDLKDYLNKKILILDTLKLNFRKVLFNKKKNCICKK